MLLKIGLDKPQVVDLGSHSKFDASLYLFSYKKGDSPL